MERVDQEARMGAEEIVLRPDEARLLAEELHSGFWEYDPIAKLTAGMWLLRIEENTCTIRGVPIRVERKHAA